jgi:SAM-dependent methyltransferase
VRGYTTSSYGDGFADVYDDWYRDVSDVDATVAMIAALAGGGHVLELGVGTGRLAIPLTAHGVHVTGIDTSEAMLRRLSDKPGGERVVVVHGDMVDDHPPGPFALVFVAYNTLFNLDSAERQRACFDAVARSLDADGVFVVEAFVPSPQPATGVPGAGLTVRSLDVDRVVLSISIHDEALQRAEGQYVELTEHAGVRLRPWSIRYAPPGELDSMADGAGLALRARWADFDRSTFTNDSDRHVSVYGRANSSRAVTIAGEGGRTNT